MDKAADSTRNVDLLQEDLEDTSDEVIDDEADRLIDFKDSAENIHDIIDTDIVSIEIVRFITKIHNFTFGDEEDWWLVPFTIL